MMKISTQEQAMKAVDVWVRRNQWTDNELTFVEVKGPLNGKRGESFFEVFVLAPDYTGGFVFLVTSKGNVAVHRRDLD